MNIKIDNEKMRDFVIDMLAIALEDYVENHNYTNELNKSKNHKEEPS